MGKDQQSDTVKLLLECNSGSKMAVSAIDEVINRTQDNHVKNILLKSKQHHADLGNEIHSLLLEHSSDDKDPNPMAKGMSWIKTNVKMTVNESDATIADLITEGCNMGVKSLNKYLNQYKSADGVSKGICNKLIEIEDKLSEDLKTYL